MNARTTRFLVLLSAALLLMALIAATAPPAHATPARTNANPASLAANVPATSATLTPAETNLLVNLPALIPPVYFTDLPVIAK